MGAGYEPPLLWLRHDRTPLKVQVKVMLNGTVLYHSIRTGARETSADTPLVMAPGCGRRLSKQEGTGCLIETIELRELPGFPGHGVSVQIIGAAGSDTATGGATSASDKVFGLRATALRTVRYSLTLDGEEVDADTSSQDYLIKYSRYIARAGQWHQLCGTGQAHKLVSITRAQKDDSGTVHYSLDIGETIARAESCKWYRYSEFSQLYNDICTCFRSTEWSKLPALPPKTWATGSTSQSSKTIDVRRKALEDWVRGMLMHSRGPRNPYLLQFLGAFDSDIWERYRTTVWPELCASELDTEPEPDSASDFDLDALMDDIAGDLGEGDLHFAVTGERTPSSSGPPKQLQDTTSMSAHAQARVVAAAKAVAAATTGGVGDAVPEAIPPNRKGAAAAARAPARSSSRDEREVLAATARTRRSLVTCVNTSGADGSADSSRATAESDSDDDAL